MAITRRPRFLGGERAAIRADRDRRRAWKALDRAVRAAEHSADDDGTLELQLVARVAGSAGYATLKSTHGEAWRRQRLPYSVNAWPPAIDEGDLAVALLPLSAGRIGLSVGKQPRPLSTPFFVTGRPIRPGDHEDVVLVAILSWLEHAR